MAETKNITRCSTAVGEPGVHGRQHVRLFVPAGCTAPHQPRSEGRNLMILLRCGLPLKSQLGHMQCTNWVPRLKMAGWRGKEPNIKKM